MLVQHPRKPSMGTKQREAEGAITQCSVFQELPKLFLSVTFDFSPEELSVTPSREGFLSFPKHHS